MRFSTSLVAITTAIGLTLALPAPEPQAFPPVSADTVYYYFKTQVQAAQSPVYNNLYLTAYHTGAGLSDATFVRNTPLPRHRGWFNGSTLNWFEPFNGSIFFGVDYYVGGGNYAAWSPVEINGGAGNPGLGLDAGNRLVVVNNTYWDSWLGMFPFCPQMYTKDIANDGFSLRLVAQRTSIIHIGEVWYSCHTVKLCEG